MDAEKKAKLPVWAQREVTILQNEIASLKTALRAATGQVHDATVFIDRYDGDVPLGTDGTRIRFDLAGRNYIAVSVEEDHKGQRAIVIQSGWNALTITPQVSNVVRIGVSE